MDAFTKLAISTTGISSPAHMTNAAQVGSDNFTASRCGTVLGEWIGSDKDFFLLLQYLIYRFELVLAQY